MSPAAHARSSRQASTGLVRLLLRASCSLWRVQVASADDKAFCACALLTAPRCGHRPAAMARTRSHPFARKTYWGSLEGLLGWRTAYGPNTRPTPTAERNLSRRSRPTWPITTATYLPAFV